MHSTVHYRDLLPTTTTTANTTTSTTTATTTIFTTTTISSTKATTVKVYMYEVFIIFFISGFLFIESMFAMLKAILTYDQGRCIFMNR